MSSHIIIPWVGESLESAVFLFASPPPSPSVSDRERRRRRWDGSGSTRPPTRPYTSSCSVANGGYEPFAATSPLQLATGYTHITTGDASLLLTFVPHSKWHTHRSKHVIIASTTTCSKVHLLQGLLCGMSFTVDGFPRRTNKHSLHIAPDIIIMMLPRHSCRNAVSCRVTSTK